jgi:hypothetical protein
LLAVRAGCVSLHLLYSSLVLLPFGGKFAWILDPDGTKIELWQSTKR